MFRSRLRSQPTGLITMVCGLIITVSTTSPIHAASITNLHGSLHTSAGNDVDNAFVQFNPSPVPVFQTDMALFGGSASVSTYSLDQQALNIGFGHLRAATADSFAQSTGSFYFQVDEDTSYTLQGSYTSTGPGMILQAVSLVDLTNNQDLFLGEQISLATTNPTLTLGLEDGDYFNQRFGSTTGTLQRGVDYYLMYSAVLGQGSANGQPDNAQGQFSLALNDGAVGIVPLPASFWIGITMLGGLGMIRKARTHITA